MLEGTLRAQDLVSYCQQHNSPAIGITDSHGLFGIPEMSAALAQGGVKPLLGLEARLRFDHSEARTIRPRLAPLVFLAMNEQGYKNLMRLASALYRADRTEEETQAEETTEKNPAEKALDDEPHLTFDHLERYHEGILTLSGGLEGPLGLLLGEERFDEAQALCRRLSALFVERFYIELNRFADGDNKPALQRERRIEEGLLALCAQQNLPPVASNNCMFENPSMHEAQDVLLAINEGVPVSFGDRRRSSPRQDLAPPERMRALFQDIPEACENTLQIAQRCSVLFEARDAILPRFAPPEEDEAAMLRKLAHEGLERLFGERLALPPQARGRAVYEERLKVELEVIVEKGLQGYFLIVADFIRWAKQQEIPVGPGRGSGAGSLVAWALAITELDPVRWGLLFERFLNPERLSMPDFDIDFCQERREQVIAYVRKRYGEEKVGQIITLGTLQARAVLRDVGRALGISYPRVDRLCKTLPAFQSLKESLKEKGNALAREAEDPSIAKLLDLAQKLEGLYRHVSTHAAGIVIGNRALANLVPLYRDKETGFRSTQFTMKYVEQAGLIKFDFLGLKTLSVIAHCKNLLKERGTELDMEGLALDSPAVFDLFSRAETFGIFQFESAGIREVLRRMRPDRFEDIIAAVALYRPGPMEHIPSYVARKHAREPIVYLHEKLEPILRETYGIPVYQEQVITMAQVLAGFSLGKSDRLRRAMGKKDPVEMRGQRKSFLEGCAKGGMEQRVASKIFEQIYAFAGYGFNKSHAAAYAMIAYQTAWLRVHHPAAFFVSMMVFDAENTDRLAQYVPCLQGLGIALLPPDVNRSRVEFVLEKQEGQSEGKDAIRYGLGALKHVGSKAMEEVVSERTRGGAFRNLFDFAERMAGKTLARRSLESLVRSGAFDALNENRAQSFEAIDLLLYVMQSREEEGQESLFGGTSQQETSQQESSQENFAPRKLPQSAAWDSARSMREEREAIGFYLSGHPLAEHRALCERAGFLTSSDLEGVGDGERVRVVGRLEEVREKKLRDSSRRLVVLSLSDPSGMFEVTLFSTQAEKHAVLREEGALLALELNCVRMPNRDRLQFRVLNLKPFNEALRRRLQGQAETSPAPVSSPPPAPAPMSSSGGEEGVVGVERLLLHVRRGRGHGDGDGNEGWDPELLAKFLEECAESGMGEIELCIREESRILRVLLGQHYRLDAALERALGELRGVESVERRRAA